MIAQQKFISLMIACLLLANSFELYLQEKEPYNEESVNNLQYEFQALGLHRKRIIKNDTINFWRCKVIGPKKNPS